MRVGLIGLGAIGKQVADGIQAGLGGDADLVGVLVQHSRPRAVAAPVVTEVGAFLGTGPQVVLEAAGPVAFAACAQAIVSSGASLITASGSALVDPTLRARLEAACVQHGTRIYVPAGAVGGLDALAAAAAGGLNDVRLRIVEPSDAERLIFRGNALAAIRQFPSRLNSAAAVTLVAGPAVQLELSQQPADRGREIELTASGAFGDLRVRLHPTPNPNRLSHIVALSLLACLRRLHQPIVFG
ncbi:MAG TPA: aspartate dehydrogenase domain-containing protein [Chloroflexota bacterium]|nr:aspartate dehydrogenase domain-containing protein [Chloroflexota bacterium]